MDLPGVPPEFQFPEDPGELLAWMKNFAEKLPQYTEQLEISDAQWARVEAAYHAIRVAKEAEDKARLRVVELELCRVPNGWPPPPVLHDLIRKIPAIEEPIRTRMLKEIERWTAAIVRARSVMVAPVLSGGYFDRGIILKTDLPEPCRWVRRYWRRSGEAAWQLLSISQGRDHLHTDPESQEEEEEKMEGWLEFVVIGQLPHEDPQKGYAEEWGAPSNVLRMEVPTEYPVREGGRDEDR